MARTYETLRTKADVTAPFRLPKSHLAAISKYCPELQSLGIAIDWDDITNANVKRQERVKFFYWQDLTIAC